MISFAWYGLQVIICSGIMMLYYWLVLRNKRFHQYNRFYILASVFLAFIIPVIKIQLDKATAEKGMAQMIYVFADYNSTIDAAVAKKGFQVDWTLLAFAVYLIVCIVFLTVFTVALIKIYKLLKTFPGKKLEDVWLILTNAGGTPFSFFKFIFWNEEIDMHSVTGKQILQHELTHVKEKHSIDAIIMQIVLTIGWINPFFWLAKRELNMIHEFIADKKSVEDGDTASFAAMLLAATYPKQQHLLVHPFFFSPIKRRLLMLTNHKNPRFSYARRVIILPLMAVVVMLFAFRMKQEEIKVDNNNKVEKVLQDLKFAKVDTVVNPNPSKIYKQFLDRNKEVKSCSWSHDPQLSIIILLKDGTSETYDLTNEKSKQRAYHKYGKLPIPAPAPPPLSLTIPNPSNLSNALIVIDGKKQEHYDIKSIDPNSIASINVLKGKGAEKYGDEGKNGVVEITTKLNSSASINGLHAFLERNKEVKEIAWFYNPKLSTHITLRNGTIETYDLENESSKQSAIDKYGELPIAPPPPPAGVPVGVEKKEVTVIGYKNQGTPQNEVSDKIFTAVQVHPEFIGGDEAWSKYLMHNLNRDLPLKRNAPPGKYTVKVSFIVNEDGKLFDVKAINNPGYGTAEEAVRVIAASADWKPAEQNGHKVACRTIQSITFAVAEK